MLCWGKAKVTRLGLRCNLLHQSSNAVGHNHQYIRGLCRTISVPLYSPNRRSTSLSSVLLWSQNDCQVCGLLSFMYFISGHSDSLVTHLKHRGLCDRLSVHGQGTAYGSTVALNGAGCHPSHLTHWVPWRRSVCFLKVRRDDHGPLCREWRATGYWIICLCDVIVFL